MKEILITNDDGFDSLGLIELSSMLKKEFDVKITIIAPAREKSACSHSITLTKILKIIQISQDFYKVEDGTPADCIYLALSVFYKDKLPDLVISGINHGANLGEDITYSGTCGGAMEAVLHNIPAIALSQYYQNDEKKDELNFTNSLKIIKKIIKNIFDNGFPLKQKEFININFPSAKIAFNGIKIAKAGKRIYKTQVESNTNPRGIKYYWLAVDTLEHIEEDSDISWIKKGYATITPIMLDLTSYDSLNKMKNWIKKL